MEIVALVEMNGRPVPVFDEIPPLIFKRIGENIIYGTNGLLYRCFYKENPSGRFKAFAGREFRITLHDGEIINCHGQWWDGAKDIVGEHIGIKLIQTAASTVDELKKCYVFCAHSVDRNRLFGLKQAYTGPVYPYDEYEKLIKYDDLRKAHWQEINKLKGAKKHLINEAETQARKRKNAERIVDEIWDMFYGQNFDLVGWHQNGDHISIDQFFEENDWGYR